jgi:hypothetical protein
MSGDEVLADSMANTAFMHYVQCVKWYRTFRHPSGDQSTKLDQIQVLYWMAIDYGQDELKKKWDDELFRANIQVEQ